MVWLCQSLHQGDIGWDKVCDCDAMLVNITILSTPQVPEERDRVLTIGIVVNAPKGSHWSAMALRSPEELSVYRSGEGPLLPRSVPGEPTMSHMS